MSSVYKEINSSDVSLTERVVHKLQTLTSDSEGLSSVRYRSGSIEASNSVYPTISGSYWSSLKSIFYLSASNTNASESSEYFHRTLAEKRVSNPQYINKFHSSGSIISIPQQYIGDRIKPKTFTLKDTSGAKDIIIQDDGFGNLYAPSASESQSAATSLSSSDNYIGNIFYNYGLIAITETGSWSGSLNYTEVTTGSFTMSFESSQTIQTQEYSITIKPGEFNRTMNPTVRGYPSKSLYNRATDTPFLADKFTGSNWSPYITTVALFPKKSIVEKERFQYNRAYEPIAIAKFPRAIKMRDDVEMTFKIRLDL